MLCSDYQRDNHADFISAVRSVLTSASLIFSTSGQVEVLALLFIL